MNFVEFLGFTPETILLIAVTVLLLALSGMMSSSEVALFSLSPADLRDIKARGTLSAEAVIKLLKRSDELLATILVVNNLVNIAIVICTSEIIHSMFRFERFEFLFTGVLATFILLFFGEILPKIVAQSANIRIALAFSQPLLLLRWLLYPVSFILVRTGGRIERFASPATENISIEELADAVDMTTEQDSEEQKILAGIVSITSR